MPTSTLVCRDPEELAERAVEIISRNAAESIGERGRAMIALSGGSTPKAAYSLMPSWMRKLRIEESKVFLFFCDERYVRADDPASNYGMVRSALGTVPDFRAHVVPIRTDVGSPDECARAYEETLRTTFADRATGPPRFDLVVLGLGEDGHTASLFPRSPSLSVQDRWVVATPPGTLPPPLERITMTFPVLNAAREILFLVSGAKKAQALRNVFADHAKAMEYPAAGIAPTGGNLTWLVDRAASQWIG